MSDRVIVVGKNERIIEALRRTFPETTWHYSRAGRWENSAGWAVQAYGMLVDEDRFTTVYRRSDTGELVGLWGVGRW